MRKISLKNKKSYSFLIYIGIAVISYNIFVIANSGTLWLLPNQDIIAPAGADLQSVP